MEKSGREVMGAGKTNTGESEKNNITQGSIFGQLLLFFFPILFGTFFQQLYNTADAVVVGHFVGKQALAGGGGTTSTPIIPRSTCW